jgi:threonine synthase
MEGKVPGDRVFVCDSTSHQLKFSGFQESYFADSLGPEYEVEARDDLVNRPQQLSAEAEAIAAALGLEKR